MIVYIVCFKEYAHGPKILEGSKAFTSNDEAQKYAKLMTDKQSRSWDSDSKWVVKELEVEQ